MQTRRVDTRQLADFLRVRREALDPGDVGLPSTGRRRTPGLRREEVARLADISTDYYTRLEQDRAPQPSPGVLRAITRALRLTLDERDHLFRLAGHRRPGRVSGSGSRDGVTGARRRLAGRSRTPRRRAGEGPGQTAATDESRVRGPVASAFGGSDAQQTQADPAP